MQAQDLERHDQGMLQVHLCFACAGLWFDHFASNQLAPSAVIGLFRDISAHRNDAKQPVASRQACPRCAEPLMLSYDLGKSGRFSYYSCHRGDGRFTPFLQFLREKQFVRDLTAQELLKVRQQVRQITCSECGAPVDLQHDSQCKYCHAPISFLDPEAIEKAMHMWSDADQRRHSAPTPESLRDALARTRSHVPSPASSSWAAALDKNFFSGNRGSSSNFDLVSLGIDVIAGLFERHH